jgi:metallo-beta-lactamase class B
VKRIAILAAAMFALTGPATAEVPAEWTKPVAPFHIIGNIYYVGTADLAAYLIHTDDGDILIDGTLKQNVPLIERNIATLGFKVSNIKILLNSHAHYDHAAGLAALKHDSGAVLYASAKDAPILESGKISFGPTASDPYPPVKVDRIVKDGEAIGLGGAKLTAHLTPGHTPGCTSWTMPVSEDGVAHTAIFYCSTSVAGNPLVNNKAYPQIASDYEASFAKLKTIKADVFLAPHAQFYHPQQKLGLRKKGGPNPFVDPGELQRFVAASQHDFEAELAKQKAQANAH